MYASANSVRAPLRLAAAWIVIFSDVLGLAESAALFVSLPHPTNKASRKTLINTNRIRFIIPPVHPFGLHTVKAMVTHRRDTFKEQTKYTIYSYYTIYLLINMYVKTHILHIYF